jgi:hypothetical protein
MDGDTDLVGIFDSLWHHAIISDKFYSDVQKNCDFSLVDLSPECNADIEQYTALYDIIDIYSLYTDRCELGYPDFNYSISAQIGRTSSGRVSAPELLQYELSSSLFPWRVSVLMDVFFPLVLCCANFSARSSQGADGVRPVHGDVRD